MVVKSLDPTAQASATSVTFKQLNLEQAPAQRPEVIAVLAQYQTGQTGVVPNVPILSDGTPDWAIAKFGGGSPLAFIADKLYPKSGDGAKVPVYYVPIADAAAATAATGDIAITGTATKTFNATLTFQELAVASAADAVGKIATNAQLNPARAPRGKKLDGFNTFGVRFTIAKGTAGADIHATMSAALDEEVMFPTTHSITATPSLELTAKWKGATGNFRIDLVDDNGDSLTDVGNGLTVVITKNMTGGVDATDVQDALDNLTETYGITRVINQYDDDTNLDLIQAWGTGLRDSLVAQYIIAYFGREYDESGTTGTVDVGAIKTFGDGRRLDPINSVLYGTYGDLRDLTYTQRDTLLKAGITNIEIRAGVRTLIDSVTFFHPLGVQNPIFAYDDSVTKEGNLAYDMQAFFGREEWESKIIVSTSSKTSNPEAIDINDFAASVEGRMELWEKTALIDSAQFAKENSTYEIDASNPRRINANIKARLTSTLRVLDNTLFLGFLFGESA